MQAFSKLFSTIYEKSLKNIFTEQNNLHFSLKKDINRYLKGRVSEVVRTCLESRIYVLGFSSVRVCGFDRTCGELGLDDR